MCLWMTMDKQLFVTKRLMRMTNFYLLSGGRKKRWETYRLDCLHVIVNNNTFALVEAPVSLSTQLHFKLLDIPVSFCVLVYVAGKRYGYIWWIVVDIYYCWGHKSVRWSSVSILNIHLLKEHNWLHTIPPFSSSICKRWKRIVTGERGSLCLCQQLIVSQLKLGRLKWFVIESRHQWAGGMRKPWESAITKTSTYSLGMLSAHRRSNTSW